MPQSYTEDKASKMNDGRDEARQEEKREDKKQE